MKKEVDFNIFKAQILEEIKAGKPLFGKDGALAPMIENIVNAVLEGEMDAHLTQESRESGNRRNGKMQKQVQTPVGDITVTTPRDRDALFDPQFIKKRETMLSEGMADRIIGLYALGTSTRDISSWLEETVSTSVSAETISSITDRVLPELEAWRNRSLDEVYPIVWLDALHYKVMDEKNRVVSRAIYNVLGIDKDGHKDLLGMYVSKSEGANFWLSVLTDLQNRGVKDIMIPCIDGLKGFPDKSVFPDTAVSEPIRKLIYTTNTVEGYHRQIRKVTKNKGVFPNDTALIKLVYLAYRNARKKWTMPVPNWGIISQQLAIKFEDRYNLL